MQYNKVCRLYAKGNIVVDTDTIGVPKSEEILVGIGAGGICGSDLHYFFDGGFGPIIVKNPIILGHEIAGTILQIGTNISTFSIGDRVAINPSTACNSCEYCEKQLFQHCINMRFLGSALRTPHEDGGFREKLIVAPSQCLKVSSHVTLGEAACAEPLAVCIHAMNQVKNLKGKRVLVCGAGPIGALCTGLLSQASAAEIIVTDLHDFPLKTALKMGATDTINVTSSSQDLEKYIQGKGYFDIVFECSAAASAIKTAFKALKPKGILVQVGVSGDTAIPLSLLVSKEIQFIGSHRFHSEFKQAVDMLNRREINVRPIISATFPMADVKTAFEIAANRKRSIKIQLSFTESTELERDNRA